MADLCAIEADYVNWRPVNGRKVLQLIFEVPIEQTANVMNKLGTPTSGESRWCAIALLESNGSATGKSAIPQKATQRPSSDTVAPAALHGQTQLPTTVSTAEIGTSETHSHDRKPFGSLPLTKQAAIRCNDAQFIEFLRDQWPHRMASDNAAEAVRAICGVRSRSEFDITSEGAAAWRHVEEEYQSWLTDRNFAEARR